jgi:hypothetical protein
MESYDIKNNMKNKSFVNEINIYPTLSKKINDYKYIYIILFKNFIENTLNNYYNT